MYNDGMLHQTHQTHLHLRDPSPQRQQLQLFAPIEKMPHISPKAQLTQVSHTQALNILQGSQGTSGPIIRRPTPVKTVEQPMDNSESSAEHTQNQPVTLVSLCIHYTG